MKLKRMVRSGIALAAAGCLLAGCAAAGGGSGNNEESSSGGPVDLTFQTLAYQKPTVAAVKQIVADWNKKNPKIHVTLNQGTWDSVHDQLVTQFEGNAAPDIIHDESSDIAGFAEQGYIADLKPHLSSDVKKSVSDGVWETVTTSDGAIIGAPTLVQTYVVYANLAAFKAAGVEPPKGKTLTWDELKELAGKLTHDGQFGAAWGLRQATSSMINMGLGFGGTFFTTKDGKTDIHIGDAEMQVPTRIHDMAFQEKTLDPVSLTQSGADAVQGFLGGKFAMLIGASALGQQITAAAPAGFDWGVLPALAGSKGDAQAANPETLSVSAQSKHPKEAAAFINFYMDPSNLAKDAEGDWLLPTSSAGRDLLQKATADKKGWAGILKTGDGLTAAPFQKALNYPQWKDQIATPAYQQYFGNKISADELKKQLTDGWQSVGG